MAIAPPATDFIKLLLSTDVAFKREKGFEPEDGAICKTVSLLPQVHYTKIRRPGHEKNKVA
ncbi:hypothetical protein [Rufibacter roseolus]|uniref:hypothetical protein n=1 Tax=Rufibacter roseolus TaxID=2817375 RepID=UPI001B3088A9|nr:hypothetical protein [Rufibacter roseolus]